MRSEIVFVFVACALLFSTLVDCRKGDKEKRSKRTKLSLKCKDKNVGEISAAEFAAGGEIKLGCKSGGLISNVSLIGYNGSCRGVPPDLYVQVLTCYWKNSCTLNYNSQSIMKVLPGSNITLCVWALPDTFTLQYECTKSADRVKVFDVLAMEDVTATGTTGRREVTEVSGVIRSHDDHPWLYRYPVGKGSSLTLKSPNKSSTSFVFTVRSLSLWDRDILKVSRTGDEDGRIIFNESYSTSNAIHHIDKAEKVTFTLSSSFKTAGGDGFIICFKWIKGKDKKKNECSKMFKPGQACEKGGDKGGDRRRAKGDKKEGKKGGKKKN